MDDAGTSHETVSPTLAVSQSNANHTLFNEFQSNSKLNGTPARRTLCLYLWPLQYVHVSWFCMWKPKQHMNDINNRSLARTTDHFNNNSNKLKHDDSFLHCHCHCPNTLSKGIWNVRGANLVYTVLTEHVKRFRLNSLWRMLSRSTNSLHVAMLAHLRNFPVCPF